MAALIGAPDLIGPTALADDPALLSRTSALATDRPGLAASGAAPATPAMTTDLPAGLPSGFFTVAAKTGELSRLWVVTGTPDSNYVWGESPRPVVGSAYRNSFPFFTADLNINAIRLPTNTFRLHNVGSGFSAYIAANDGGADEPDLAVFVHTSASTVAEFKFSESSGAGGGFANWATNTGLKAQVATALATAGTQAILVLANASA